MIKQIIRLTESDLHRIIKESVQKILSEDNLSSEKHIYTAKEMQWLYDNQEGLTPIQQKVLNAGMWVRARKANYNGYDKNWPNIGVYDGQIYYFGNNGEMKKVPF